MTKAAPANLNIDNPLAEKERHNRIHACMLSRGYTHAVFAKTLGVHWTSLKRWLSGEQDIGLEPLIKISKLTGFTLDQLVFGVDAAAPPTNGKSNGMSLTIEEQRAYLDRQLIPNKIRGALTRALERKELALFSVNEDLMAEFCSEYAIHLGDGDSVAFELSLARVLGAADSSHGSNGKGQPTRKRK
jgi:transcriptional regulator with XRE-family HTH domain